MAVRTLYVGIVFIGVYAPDLRPAAREIRKRKMTSKALLAGLIDGKFEALLRRMISCHVVRRSMAVFALNDSMGGFNNGSVLFGMAALAVFPAHVLYFYFFPVLFIGRPVPAVHVAALTDTKVSGDLHEPYQQDQENDADDND